MSTLNLNTINSAIAAAAAIITSTDSKYDARARANATKSLGYWTGELASYNKSVQAPSTGQGKNEEKKTVNTNKPAQTPAATIANDKHSWFSKYMGDIKAEVREEKRANHIYGLDSDTGIQHEPGDTAIYILRQALQASPAKRDYLLTRADIGFNAIDKQLTEEINKTEETNEQPTLRLILDVCIAQFVIQNPTITIPPYMEAISDDQLCAIQDRLDRVLTDDASRRAGEPVQVYSTLAQLFYVVIREAKERLNAKSK